MTRTQADEPHLGRLSCLDVEHSVEGGAEGACCPRYNLATREIWLLNPSARWSQLRVPPSLHAHYE